MKDLDTMNDLIKDDELINDFEFAEQLYNVRFSQELKNGLFDEKEIRDDFVSMSFSIK